MKRTYNVDENRVVLSGVSDGGTGAYYVAMRDTTPFSSFLPLNGFIVVLANPSMDLREGLFPNNLRNKPFFVVNGGQDPLYPAARVEPYVKHFQRGRRRDRVPAAAGRRPQHGVVAGGEGRVRSLRPHSSAPAAAGHA